MRMSNTISGVSATTQQYADYSSVTSKQAEKKATETTSANNGVVYEKSDPASTNKATNSINTIEVDKCENCLQEIIIGL